MEQKKKTPQCRGKLWKTFFKNDKKKLQRTQKTKYKAAEKKVIPLGV